MDTFIDERDYDSLLAEKPPYSPPYIIKRRRDSASLFRPGNGRETITN